jgi:hypothetical protein
MKTRGDSFLPFPHLKSRHPNVTSYRMRSALAPQTTRTALVAISSLVLAFGFAGSRVSAQTIVPVSQARNISAGSGSVSTAAVDFAVFDATVQIPGGYSASQNSEIDAASISASGFASGDAAGGLDISRFTVTFDLVTSCTYTLSGSVAWVNSDEGFGGGPPFVVLSSTSGTNFYAIALPMSGDLFSTNGVLPAGEYTLSAQAAADAFHGENDSYNLTFSVSSDPCTAGECQTGLLGYWTFDEGSGSTAGDSSTNGNTGTIIDTGTNSIAWVSGVVGGALHFDNQTQVIVSNAPSLDAFSGITISTWVKADYWGSTGYAPRILEKGNLDNQYALLSTSSGQLEFLLSGVSNGVLVASAPSAGSWHLVSGTYNGSSMILYIDGLIAAQQPASGFLALTSDALAIGSAPSGSQSNMFSGSLDDMRIYGNALSATEISQLYNTNSVGDGIPNRWRAQYFGAGSSTGTASCATCDFDGTGQNNFFKYIAGLDPTNPSSIFSMNVAIVSTNLAAGLVANYTFDGNLTNDASGNGYSGIATGGVTLTKDRFGNPNSALSCDGTTGYIRISTPLTTSLPFTWSAWFRPGFTSTNLPVNLLNQGGAPGQGNVMPSLWINYPNPGDIVFYGPLTVLSQTRAQWDSNVWYHVAAIADLSGNRYLYVNGVLEGSVSDQAIFGPIYPNFYIGANAAYSQHYFLGDIDDVRVYNRALSAQEVQGLYTGSFVVQPRLQYSPALTGRTYTPQFSTDLVSGVWLPLAFTGLVTNGSQATITDTNVPLPAKFYRIDISQP